MTTKHTPGMLEIDPDNDLHIRLAPGEWGIADVCGQTVHLDRRDRPAQHEIDAANARELAHRWNSHDALVEALEALRELVRQVEISGGIDDHGHPMANLAVLADARAALAKAKGGA